MTRPRLKLVQPKQPAPQQKGFVLSSLTRADAVFAREQSKAMREANWDFSEDGPDTVRGYIPLWIQRVFLR